MRRKSRIDHKYNEPKEEYYHNSKYNLEIKQSNILGAGKGVFTNECINSNTFIDEYTGNIMKHICCGSYFILLRDGYGIDAQEYPRCYMAMINDIKNSKFEYNCKLIIDNVNDLVEVWSIKNIEAGEELFLDYGDSYW